MNKDITTVVLGDEYDDVLRDALRDVLLSNGAVGVDRSWGLGGSQEIETLKVRLGDDVITIEAETFIGLTISGTKSVVDDITQKVRQKIKPQHNKQKTK